MKTVILFLFSSGLVSAAPNGTILGQPRMEDCGKIRDNPYDCRFSKNKRTNFLADMPSFMKNADRIVGGQDAPSPIPWQVYKGAGCGGTILDSTTILSAAHCNYYVGESIRAGSLKEESGGEVC